MLEHPEWYLAPFSTYEGGADACTGVTMHQGYEIWLEQVK